jgi:polyferredoxin
MSTTDNPQAKRKLKKAIRPKIWRMQNARRFAQLAFFALFVWLMAMTVFPLTSPVPVDGIMLLDPLVALSSSIASRNIHLEMVIPAGIILLLTIFLGRFFCGWLCPMGTVIDLSDRFLVRRRKEEGQSRFRNFKYYLLIALLASTVFSVQWTYLFDPLSLITRTFIWVFAAPILMTARLFGGFGWVYQIAPGFSQSALIPEMQPYFQMNLLAAVIFAGILALGLISKRFWCRNLCPLGALLALFSKFGLVRRQTDRESCLECRKCEFSCKMGAIMPNPRDYQATECVYCFNCVEACGTGLTSFPISAKKEGFHTETDLTRRRMLGAMGVGLLGVGLARGDAGSKRVGSSGVKSSSPYLIRPPGSLAEEEFLSRCTRCGLCMKACPTNGLQPTFSEAGLEGFWSPILVPRLGYCSQNCTLCGQVCPTDAIKPFTAQEKAHLYIGRACIDRSQCLVWAEDKECLVCDEVCSFRAVHWKVVDGRRRPFVNDEKCVGCGMCENKCPIQPQAAIRVISSGDLRHLSRDDQRIKREQADTPSAPNPYGR